LAIKRYLIVLLLFLTRVNSLAVGLVPLVVAVIFTRAGLVSWIASVALVGGGLCFAVSAWRFGWRIMGLSALILAFAFRLCAISLGERDISRLRSVLSKRANRTVAFFYQGRNIWNEVGLLSAALGRPALRVYSHDEAVDVVRSGAVLVVNNLDRDAVGAMLESRELGLHAVNKMSWWRWRRSFTIPSINNLTELGDRRNQREYRLFWLD
jgi:hypothetical protein